MRNRYLERLNSRVLVRIVGSNINGYLRRVVKKKIRIVKLIPVSYKEVHVILDYSEYLKLLEIKSTYEVSIIENLGSRKMISSIKRNSVLLICMIMGLFLIVFLSRVMFRVEVIHQDREVRALLESELKKYGVVKYSLKKDYEDLEEIEEQILLNNKERLEWIEIAVYGTKYIVRVEERKQNNSSKEEGNQSIVSKKDAVIVRIEAKSGEKLKTVNDYVKEGETVIAGYITHPDNSKVAVRAEGTVYGEVWYQVNVDYPIVYQESNLTGRKKTSYVFYFLDHRFSLFDFKEFRTFLRKSKVLIKSNLLDIKLVKEVEYEADTRDEVYTEDIVRSKAIDYIKDKLMKDNRDIMEVREVKILDEIGDGDSISFKLFVRVVEDIGMSVLVEDDELVEEPGTS